MMKINETTNILCSKCVLVPYKEYHVQRYHEWMQNAELQELTASDPLTLEQEYEMQKSWRDDENKCTFIITDRFIRASGKSETEAMIGDVNLFFNDLDDKHSAEVEIMIAEPSARGKGIGKEAVLAMLVYGVEKLHIKTFTTKIGFTNIKSISLFQKFGFVEVSRSAAFQEITQMLNITNEKLAGLKNQLVEYEVTKES